jgi:hypothetical protein
VVAEAITASKPLAGRLQCLRHARKRSTTHLRIHGFPQAGGARSAIASSLVKLRAHSEKLGVRWLLFAAIRTQAWACPPRPQEPRLRRYSGPRPIPVPLVRRSRSRARRERVMPAAGEQSRWGATPRRRLNQPDGYIPKLYAGNENSTCRLLREEQTRRSSTR